MFMSLRDPQSCSAILIDPETQRRDLFQNMLSDRGMTIRRAVASVSDARAAFDGIDLAIIHVGFGGGGALEQLRSLCDSSDVPVLALTDESEASVVAAILAAGADEVAPVGVKADRIAFGAASAIASNAKLKKLARAKEKAETALQDHKLISRAKGILMTRQLLSEGEAHRKVQELSMARNIPLGEMARQILDAETLLN